MQMSHATAVRFAGGGLAVVAALTLVGCGGPSKYQTRRTAVNTYFDRVDRAEAPLAGQSKDIDDAFAKFKIVGNSKAELEQLQSAQKEIAATLKRVQAIPAPEAAAKIHRDIVTLLERQQAVANDLVLTTSYVPRLSTVLVPLQRADAGLTRDLDALNHAGAVKGKSAPVTLSEALAGFATAFQHYSDALKPVAAQLDRLTPPLELRDDLLAQRSAVHRSVALSSAIVAALGKKDVKTANADIHTLFTIAPQTSVIGTPQAERNALRAYNARLESITRLEVAINRERARLVRSVG
jgi:hypothetical protein